METSLIIPCTPNHFVANLSKTLKSYENNTVQPDEIIVSLSEYKKVEKDQFDKQELKYLMRCINNEIFKKFTLLNHADKKTHGPNRQAGSEVAQGDILIYGDADDKALPQRIEIIKYFFENFDIQHLNHQWVGDISKSRTLDIPNIKFIPSEKIYTHYFTNNNLSDCTAVFHAYGGDLLPYTHTGNTAVLKSSLEKIRWKDWSELTFGPAEDYEFCMENVFHFKKSILINAPLIEYSNAGWLDGSFGEYYNIL